MHCQRLGSKHNNLSALQRRPFPAGTASGYLTFLSSKINGACYPEITQDTQVLKIPLWPIYHKLSSGAFLPLRRLSAWWFVLLKQLHLDALVLLRRLSALCLFKPFEQRILKSISHNFPPVKGEEDKTISVVNHSVILPCKIDTAITIFLLPLISSM